jgi:hypothetical protein
MAIAGQLFYTNSIMYTGSIAVSITGSGSWGGSKQERDVCYIPASSFSPKFNVCIFYEYREAVLYLGTQFTNTVSSSVTSYEKYLDEAGPCSLVEIALRGAYCLRHQSDDSLP